MDYREPAQMAGYRVGVFAPSNTATQLEGIRAGMIDAGLTPIKIDQRPDDAAGFRKLAAGRVDAVFSNRDRGRDIIKQEGHVGRHRKLRAGARPGGIGRDTGLFCAFGWRHDALPDQVCFRASSFPDGRAGSSPVRCSKA